MALTLGRVAVKPLRSAENTPASTKHTSTTHSARPIRKPKIPRTLTSLFSCVTSGFSGFIGCPCGFLVSMMHLRHFRPQQVIYRIQRPLLPLPAECYYPDSSQLRLRHRLQPGITELPARRLPAG